MCGVWGRRLGGASKKTTTNGLPTTVTTTHPKALFNDCRCRQESNRYIFHLSREMLTKQLGNNEFSVEIPPAVKSRGALRETDPQRTATPIETVPREEGGGR